MSAPEVQTEVTIVTEGLKKAGVVTPSSDVDYSRATTTWLEEIKNDVQLKRNGRKLMPMQTNAITIATLGISHFVFPTDFIKDISMQLMDGNTVGLCPSSGTTSLIKLASGHGLSTSDVKGKEVVIYEGTGIRQSRQCTAISGDDMTVSPVLSTANDNTSRYMIIDTYEPITGAHHVKDIHGAGLYTIKTGKPYKYFMRGGSTTGEFELVDVPNRTSGVPYPIRLWYYANLEKLDLASSTLLDTLYGRWRMMWVQGIKAKKMESLQHDDFKREDAIYRTYVENVIKQEMYENNLKLQMKVTDYGP